MSGELEFTKERNFISFLVIFLPARGEIGGRITFSKNKENGPFKEFFPSGQLSVSGNYKNGNTEDGPLLFYNEEGKLVKKMICSGGICRTQWKDNQSTK